MTQQPTYNVKGLYGKRPSITFRCSQCNHKLTALLTDAGTDDTCPTCHTPLRVPGEVELKKWNDWQSQSDVIAAMKRDAEAVEAQKVARPVPENTPLPRVEPSRAGNREITWHAQLNNWLAQRVGLLNAIVFVLCIFAGSMFGLFFGIIFPEDVPRHILGPFIGLTIGTAVGFLLGLVSCSLIALIINISNRLDQIADQQNV
ncbi:MAG: permease [Phycisphaerales bacterium]|nr:permease [Phycisphaerales bacterium]